MASGEEKQQKEPMAPPQPPPIKRQIKFYALQALGLPLIAIFPLLAMFKVFDTTLETTSTTENGLALTVRYPKKLRYRTFEPMQISVRNETGAEQEQIEVKIDRKFIQQFRDANFNPNVSEVDNRDYIVEFDKVKPGEERTVEIDLQADAAGSLTAHCSAEAGDAQVDTEVSTWIYP